MIEHTVTDRGHYEEITLTGWGEATHLDAVHIMYDDTIGAVILEPEDRTNTSLWDEDAEERFRGDVRYLVYDFEEQPDTLIFDPGRDRQTEEEL